MKIKGQQTIAEGQIKTNKGKLCANYNQPELATGCCGPRCFIWVLEQTVQIHEKNRLNSDKIIKFRYPTHIVQTEQNTSTRIWYIQT